MTIQTRSLFYYVAPVVLENRFLDFSEGGPNIAVEVPVGARAPQELIDTVSAAHNELGGQDYTYTYDRATNRVTISATSNFELNVTTGPNSGQSIFDLIGFTSDKSGSNSYTADETFANEFRPQFWLQNYKDPEKFVETVKANVNEAGNGDTETFSFGKRKFYRMRITFITDIPQNFGAPVEDIANSVLSAEQFMQFIIDKTNLEFMPDRDVFNTYDVIKLESAPNNAMGTGFELKELTNKGMAGYFDTGELVFRKVDI